MKNLKTIICVLLCGAVSLSLVGCGTGSKASVLSLQSQTETYAYSAASASAVLNAFTEVAEDVETETTETTENILSEEEKENKKFEERVELVNNYMPVVESLLSGEGVKIEEGESDNENYTKMLTVALNDILNNNLSFVMYYNEVVAETALLPLNTAEEVETENERPEKPEKEDDEKKVNIEGILVIGETQYDIKGITESDDEETEMKFTAAIDENNKIVVENEIENGEVEFEYSVYSEGRLVERTSFESETKRNGEEVELLVLKDNKKTHYKFYTETLKDGTAIIHGEIKDDEVNLKFSLTIDENGEYTYNFNNKPFKHERRMHKHHEFRK